MLSSSVALRSRALAFVALAIAFIQPAAVQQAITTAPNGGVVIQLAQSDERHRERITVAAHESLRLLGGWLGSTPNQPIHFTSIPAAAGDAVHVELDTPWRVAYSAMELESQIAYRLARLYWTPSSAEPQVVRGLAWYLQSRIVEHLFNVAYARPGYRSESLRLFGGHVPYELPSLRLDRWHADAVSDRRLPSDIDSFSIRVASAFASLERYLGWPALQGALLMLAREQAPLTAARVNEIISAAVGQDLTWFFQDAFNPQRTFEYALRDLVTESADGCISPPCHRTRVTAVRLGNAVFSGTSRQPVGEFEAGAGIELQVQFDDGQRAVAAWDGRDSERVFEFESATPAAVATLDPAGRLLLDVNPLDHEQRRVAANNVPVMKWMARWSVWLQHALLTYMMLV